MTAKHPTSEAPRPRDRASASRRSKQTNAGHERPVGVQGPNVGYWQSVGASRAAAKRSKRP
jgi:hypothetical protein